MEEKSAGYRPDFSFIPLKEREVSRCTNQRELSATLLIWKMSSVTCAIRFSKWPRVYPKRTAGPMRRLPKRISGACTKAHITLLSPAQGLGDECKTRPPAGMDR